MPRRRKRILIAAALGLLAACAGIGWIGSQLSAPAPRLVGEAPSDLPAETVEFKSASGSRIRAWWIMGEPGTAAIVLAHSLRGDRREMLGRARFLHSAGYSVLLFDAQAHGESPGEHITFGYLEAHDARAAVEFARQRSSQVAYIGRSLGGAAALLGDEPLAVDALILEAVYPTLREATHNRIAIRLGPLAGLLAPLLLVQVEPRIGVSSSSIAPIDSISELRAQLLIIAGETDQHTTLAQSQRLFDAAPEPKWLWVIQGAAHVDYHQVRRQEYERRVLAFLGRAGL